MTTYLTPDTATNTNPNTNKPTTHTTVLPTQPAIHHLLFKPVTNSANESSAYKNPYPSRTPKNTLWDKISALRSQARAKWVTVDESSLAIPRALPVNRQQVSIDDWKIWFVGHATVLVQMGEFNFITDPVWAERCSPFAFAGPKRYKNMGIALEDLPQIHAVLLSHNHYDHMDLATLNWLHARDQMPIYTGLGNGQYLPEDFKVIELDWWESIDFVQRSGVKTELRIVYTPTQHFSGRGLRDGNTALWGALSILTPTEHLYFGGDTAYADHFNAVKQKLGAPRIALLPIGAYEPVAFFSKFHMNPAEAVQALLDLDAETAIAIHYGMFQLTYEGINQPLLDLAYAMTDLRVPSEKFITLNLGESFDSKP